MRTAARKAAGRCARSPVVLTACMAAVSVAAVAAHACSGTAETWRVAALGCVAAGSLSACAVSWRAWRKERRG